MKNISRVFIKLKKPQLNDVCFVPRAGINKNKKWKILRWSQNAYSCRILKSWKIFVKLLKFYAGGPKGCNFAESESYIFIN